MRRALPAWAVVALLAAVFPACAQPCEALAERTCAKVGAGDALCRHLREVAVAPAAADRTACATGLAFADELERH